MNSKVALITGSAKGLGRAFAESLLNKGAKVFISDVDTVLLNKTYGELKTKYNSQVQFKTCDVTNKSDMESLFADTKSAFGNIDIVCNNAGIVHEAKWEKMVEVNLMAMIRGSYLGIDYMGSEKGGRGGVIVNVSSEAAYNVVPFMPSYCASKVGILAFTCSLAAHPANVKNNIRMNCLCPAFANTDILKLDSEQVLGLEMAKKLLKIMGVLPVDKVVDGFMRLVEDESINGQALRITSQGSKLDSV